ncbi:hypothetical protein GS901_03600 [Rhodococcus hoagii]|nr:hypothetical protein [Prescottella equi]
MLIVFLQVCEAAVDDGAHGGAVVVGEGGGLLPQLPEGVDVGGMFDRGEERVRIDFHRGLRITMRSYRHRLHDVRRTPPSGDRQCQGEALVDVGEVADADPADVLAAEPDGGVAVQGHPSACVARRVSAPRCDEDAPHCLAGAERPAGELNEVDVHRLLG